MGCEASSSSAIVHPVPPHKQVPVDPPVPPPKRSEHRISPESILGCTKTEPNEVEPVGSVPSLDALATVSQHDLVV